MLNCSYIVYLGENALCRDRRPHALKAAGLNLTRCAALTRGRSGQPAIQPAHPGAHAGPHAVQVADIGKLSSTSVHRHAAAVSDGGRPFAIDPRKVVRAYRWVPLFCGHHWPAARSEAGSITPCRLAVQTGVCWSWHVPDATELGGMASIR
jgi:hypothetical protein